jgi:hypothetical protein
LNANLLQDGAVISDSDSSVSLVAATHSPPVAACASLASVDRIQTPPAVAGAYNASVDLRQTPDRVPAVAGASNASADLRQTPDRVIKDMQFLKSSWANMTEEEEEIQKNVEATEQVNPDEGFQLSISKHQKKALKKKSVSSKDSYATRSKVPSKPFK